MQIRLLRLCVFLKVRGVGKCSFMQRSNKRESRDVVSSLCRWTASISPVSHHSEGKVFCVLVCNRPTESRKLCLVFHFLISSVVVHSLYCFVGVVKGVWRPCGWDSLDLRQESHLEIGWDQCLEHVPPPPPATAVFSRLLAEFERIYWCVFIRFCHNYFKWQKHLITTKNVSSE